MIRVRDAGPLDYKAIVNFQILMAKETEGIVLNTKTVTHGVKQLFAKPDMGRYFVAESEGEVIASSLVTYEWSDWRNGTVCWLQSVYVLPAYRQKGVFRRMYEHIQNMVAEDESLMGIRLYVDKSNIQAQQVYKHLGMDGDHYALFEWMKRT
ncbi:MAG: GNAT family N-acetyltransferase [Chlorobi bacterium]|nr:GNAT family N-acetyltransferase [Chlorobiota bacterium]